ncbi:GNAT family N-acetyltransferase [Clostridium sp. Marseille-P299]|uniref:GNAT family N-acetyltransferase n=1 Tax=Clostridium sp. Marseille-P299 TaxID=1805477 RepID=UPI000834F986|nr:GNAT family N-acetyltransferase [Clostridium sp. Marseille-P299]
MIFRDYVKEDEEGWIRCRVISFLDCSYFDDIKKEKETYENPSISLVAEENGVIVGFIDVEYETSTGDVCYIKGDIGATIWHLGVLPEYRNKGVARQLFEIVRDRLIQNGIKRIEVWTQDDEMSNQWYKNQGFELKEAYLNAFIRGTGRDDIIKKFINLENIGDIYGVRSFNFEAPIERKEELIPVCYRLHEVRVYELML